MRTVAIGTFRARMIAVTLPEWNSVGRLIGRRRLVRHPHCPKGSNDG
jgi:hypothetical protein